MSTPQDPDRPAEQPAFPDAPPPPESQQGPGQASHESYPPQNQGYGGQGQQYGGQGQQYGGQGQQYGGQQYGNQGQQYPSGQPGQQYSGGQQSYPGQPGGGQPGGQPGGQQYAGGPDSYGNAPAYNPYGQPGFGTPPGSRPDVAPPPDVVRATWLMIASVVIGVIGAIITFASGDSIKDSIREGDSTLTASEVDSAYNVIVGTAVVFGLLFAVLYLLLAWQVRKGKNWARITTWVLAGLGVLGGLLGLLGNGTGLEKGLNVIQLLIAIGIIVLLARKPANEYFAAMRGRRY
jgi:hypothetical protein